MKPSPKMMTTVSTTRTLMSWTSTTIASTSSTKRTNHGSCRGPSMRLDTTSGTSRVVSGA